MKKTSSIQLEPEIESNKDICQVCGLKNEQATIICTNCYRHTHLLCFRPQLRRFPNDDDDDPFFCSIFCQKSYSSKLFEESRGISILLQHLLKAQNRQVIESISKLQDDSLKVNAIENKNISIIEATNNNTTKPIENSIIEATNNNTIKQIENSIIDNNTTKAIENKETSIIKATNNKTTTTTSSSSSSSSTSEGRPSNVISKSEKKRIATLLVKQHIQKNKVFSFDDSVIEKIAEVIASGFYPSVFKRFIQYLLTPEVYRELFFCMICGEVFNKFSNLNDVIERFVDYLGSITPEIYRDYFIKGLKPIFSLTTKNHLRFDFRFNPSINARKELFSVVGKYSVLGLNVASVGHQNLTNSIYLVEHIEKLRILNWFEEMKTNHRFYESFPLLIRVWRISSSSDSEEEEDDDIVIQFPSNNQTWVALYYFIIAYTISTSDLFFSFGIRSQCDKLMNKLMSKEGVKMEDIINTYFMKSGTFEAIVLYSWLQKAWDTTPLTIAAINTCLNISSILRRSYERISSDPVFLFW